MMYVDLFVHVEDDKIIMKKLTILEFKVNVQHIK